MEEIEKNISKFFILLKNKDKIVQEENSKKLYAYVNYYTQKSY
jgi:hypothetical protein